MVWQTGPEKDRFYTPGREMNEMRVGEGLGELKGGIPILIPGSDFQVLLCIPHDLFLLGLLPGLRDDPLGGFKRAVPGALGNEGPIG